VSQFLSPRSALVPFSQVIDLAPSSAQGYRGRAWASLANQCNVAATEDFTRVLELEPDDGEAYRGRAWAHLLAGDYAAARADFGESLQRARNPAESYAGIALAHHFAGRGVEAREHFRLAMRFRPAFNDATIYSRAGSLLVAPAVELRTVESFSPRARRLFEEDPRFRADVSTRLDDWGRYAKVLARLRQEVQRGPRSADAWLAIAVVSYRQLDDDPGVRVSGTARREARSAIDRAVAADPDDVDIRLARAMFLATPETADPQGALADFDMAIARSPNDADAYLRRSMLHATMNQFDRALEDCSTVLELEADHPFAPRLCRELDVRRVQLERSLQLRARYEQRYQEMESVAWIAIGAMLGAAVSGMSFVPLL
jgi:tetratricopeptide (TPR) repeat protein